MFNLFTYGTLMDGRSRNSILESLGAVKLSDTTISGVKLYDYYYKDKTGTENFPVALDGTDDDMIEGEIYRCEDFVLPYIDNIENVDTATGLGEMYNRRNISDTDVPLFVYVGVSNTWNRVQAPFLVPYKRKGKWMPRNL